MSLDVMLNTTTTTITTDDDDDDDLELFLLPNSTVEKNTIDAGNYTRPHLNISFPFDYVYFPLNLSSFSFSKNVVVDNFVSDGRYVYFFPTIHDDGKFIRYDT